MFKNFVGNCRSFWRSFNNMKFAWKGTFEAWMVKFGGKIGTLYQMLKNAFKKHPLQNRTNVQIKGGEGSKAFWTMFKKTALFWKEGIPYSATQMREIALIIWNRDAKWMNLYIHPYIWVVIIQRYKGERAKTTTTESSLVLGTDVSGQNIFGPPWPGALRAVVVQHRSRGCGTRGRSRRHR